MAEARQLQTPVSPAQRTSSIRQVVEDGSPPSAGRMGRKPVPTLQHPEVRLQEAPASPVSISPPRRGIQEPESASIRGYVGYNEGSPSARHVGTPDSSHVRDNGSISLPVRSRESSGHIQYHDVQPHSRASSASGPPRIEEFGPELPPPVEEETPQSPGLHYHGFDDAPRKKQPQNRQSQMTVRSVGSSSSGGNRNSQLLQPQGHGLQRPASAYTLGSELRGRTLSPLSANGSDQGSPRSYARDVSNSRRSPSSRPMSYIDLLSNVPYNQQIAPGPQMNNVSLQNLIGNAASLVDTKKTLEMYRANVKKTNDASVQYEFAIFMINAAKECMPGNGLDPSQLIQEAKQILQKLADRAYPFAQYYLGDGYFSGLFNKDKPDHDKAFPLFMAASKHGHAEAGYRAALCYEFGWGTTKSYPKAVQFYRNAASKNHPGAATRLGLACLKGDMGLSKDKYREGVKWLKRAQESADFQYNTAPYELGLLHLQGFGSDIFKDETYAAQLLTQSAELGHVQANYMMGQAYENALYNCPKDAALSVHFYNGAATRGHPDAMMALCAWYMVGAEPVMEKDEAEAWAWARQAADTGYAKAEYAVGYFTEMGIGCRRDPLEANMLYVSAADKGYEPAKQRIAIIRAAASGDSGVPMSKADAKVDELGGKKKKILGIF
ncbi:Chitin synthase 4 [Recurvomyces mirabilis]|nr:Chitin synthase 4 [Recurvomyces mirabilis]